MLQLLTPSKLFSRLKRNANYCLQFLLMRPSKLLVGTHSQPSAAVFCSGLPRSSWHVFGCQVWRIKRRFVNRTNLLFCHPSAPPTPKSLYHPFLSPRSFHACQWRKVFESQMIITFLQFVWGSHYP